MARFSYLKSKNILRNILEPYEFIYFGNISKNDDYIPIRGITSSISHRDYNFYVGTIDDYDIRVINRIDKYTVNNKKHITDKIIIEIKLKKYSSDNACILMPHSHDTLFENLINRMSVYHEISPAEKYDRIDEFHSRFKLYSNEYIDTPLDTWLDIETQNVLAVHAWPFSFEIDANDIMYVYLNRPFSEIDFDWALKIGVWLADKLDCYKKD
jgi:hypothetical protein